MFKELSREQRIYKTPKSSFQIQKTLMSEKKNTLDEITCGLDTAKEKKNTDLENIEKLSKMKHKE